MRSCLFILAMLISPTGLTQTAEIQPPIIQEGDIATLTIEMESKIPSLYGLDTTDLEQNFEIVASESRILSIREGGDIKRRMQWKLDLFPKHIGRLEIPSLMLGQKPTPPLSLQVDSRGVEDRKQHQIILETRATPEAPYQNQQVILTLRLLYNTDLAQGRLYEPEIESDFIALRSGQDQKIQQVIDGHQFEGIERKIHIFADTVGINEIPSARFRGELSTNSESGRKILRISKALTLPVKSRPANYQGNFWLPARELQISQSWDNELTDLTASDTIKRTILIEATGLAAEFLPENLLEEYAHPVKIYPDQAIRNNRFIDENVAGRLEQSYAVILPESGLVELPEITLSWWDTDSSVERQLTLPSVELDIKPSSPATLDGSANRAADNLHMETVKDTGIPLPFIVAGLLLVIMTAIWRYRWQISEWYCLIFDRSKRLYQLRQACDNNDPMGTRRELIQWARSHWSDRKIAGLQTIAEVFGNSEFSDELSRLDQYLFSNNQSEWHGQRLWSLLIRHLTSGQRHTARESNFEASGSTIYVRQ